MDATTNMSRLRAALACAAGTCAVVAVVFLSAVQQYSTLQGQMIPQNGAVMTAPQVDPAGNAAMPGGMMPTPTMQEMPMGNGAAPMQMMAPGILPTPSMGQNMSQGMIPTQGMTPGMAPMMTAPMQQSDMQQMQGQGMVPVMAPPITAPVMQDQQMQQQQMMLQHQAAPVVAPTPIPTPTVQQNAVAPTDPALTAVAQPEATQKVSLWQKIGDFINKIFGWN